MFQANKAEFTELQEKFSSKSIELKESQTKELDLKVSRRFLDWNLLVIHLNYLKASNQHPDCAIQICIAKRQASIKGQI